MIFVEWPEMRDDAGIVLLMLAAILLIVRSKHWAKPARILAWIVSVPMMLIGALLSLLIVAGSFFVSREGQPAVYSPDRTKAARVFTTDAGALGGGFYVKVYMAHGFWTETVFGSEWATTDASNVHWLSNRELEIVYQGKRLHATTFLKSPYIALRTMTTS